MKTKIYNTTEQVSTILETATKRYEDLTGICGLTSDFLLKTILVEFGENNELLRYLFVNNLFSPFYIKHNQKLNLEREEALKKYFNFFVTKIEADYKNFANISEEALNNYYSERFPNNNYSIGTYINQELTYEVPSYKETYSAEVKTILAYAEKISSHANVENNQIDFEALLVSLVQHPNFIWDYLFAKPIAKPFEFGEKLYFTEFYKLRDVFSEKNYVQSSLKNWHSHCSKEDEQTKFEITPFKEDLNLGLDNIMAEAPDFLKLLCPEFTKDKNYTILGRDKEIKKSFSILQKMTCKNIIFTGAGGVGKTAMFEGIQEHLIKGDCPKALKGKIILYLDINIFLSNTKYVGQSQEKFAKLSEYLETHPKVILAIDEIHSIVGAGRGSNSSHDFANALKPLLTSGKTSIIGATTEKEYMKWIEPDEPLKRRFVKINISEPKDEDLWQMLQGKKAVLEKFHDVKVRKESFEYIISQSASFNYYIPKPARIVELLDNAMVIAKENGKNVLDNECIDEANVEAFEKYKKFKKMYPKQLMGTSYHETGHFLLHQEHLTDFKDISVISIIPADGHLGINVFELKETNLPVTKGVVIQRIAQALAGNKAEELYGYPNNSGKCSDLKFAYEYAKSAILNQGLVNTEKTALGQYIYIAPDSKLEELSDNQKECLSKEISTLMDKGEKLAEEVLKRRKDKLELIAKELFDKGALTKNQLESLYNQKEQNAVVESELLLA